MGGGSDESGRLHIAILNYLESAERGAPLDPAALLAAYPDVASDLAGFLDCYARLEVLTAPVRYVVQRAAALGAPQVAAR